MQVFRTKPFEPQSRVSGDKVLLVAASSRRRAQRSKTRPQIPTPTRGWVEEKGSFDRPLSTMPDSYWEIAGSLHFVV
jgi:hypothetical protein